MVNLGSVLSSIFGTDNKKKLKEFSQLVKKINESFVKSSKKELNKVLAITEEKLVSIDFNHNPASSIYDSELSKVINGNLIKVVAWYDNEWGFSNRMLDTTIALMNAK